ncbi:MAG: DUF3889 domain-containing protein [Bacilli bacterium]
MRPVFMFTCFVLYLTVWCNNDINVHANSAITTEHKAYAKPEEPTYAKWGRLAMQETKNKYPRADIVDYLHVGAVTESPSITVDKFKLWLRQDQREGGVYVNIHYETATDRVIPFRFRKRTNDLNSTMLRSNDISFSLGSFNKHHFIL